MSNASAIRVGLLCLKDGRLGEPDDPSYQRIAVFDGQRVEFPEASEDWGTALFAILDRDGELELRRLK